MKRILLLLFALLYVCVFSAAAQDLITLKTGETISGMIVAINNQFVIYDDGSAVTATVRSSVEKIEFENGVVEYLVPPLPPELFVPEDDLGTIEEEEQKFQGATVGSERQKEIYTAFYHSIPDNRFRFHPEDVNSKSELKQNLPGQKPGIIKPFIIGTTHLLTLGMTFRKPVKRTKLHNLEKLRRKALLKLNSSKVEENPRKRRKYEKRLEKYSDQVEKIYKKMRRKGWTYEKTKKRDQVEYWEENGGKD